MTTQRLDEAEWLQRFMRALLPRMPTLTAAEVSGYAAQTFRDASDLSPEEAATIFAVERPPAEVGAPE